MEVRQQNSYGVLDQLNLGAITRTVRNILVFCYFCSPLSIGVGVVIQITHVTETMQP